MAAGGAALGETQGLSSRWTRGRRADGPEYGKKVQGAAIMKPRGANWRAAVGRVWRASPGSAVGRGPALAGGPMVPTGGQCARPLDRLDSIKLLVWDRPSCNSFRDWNGPRFDALQLLVTRLTGTLSALVHKFSYTNEKRGVPFKRSTRSSLQNNERPP